MRIINIQARKQLNNFIVQKGESNFLQSWEWGEFQRALGRSIWVLGIEEGRELLGTALLIKKGLPRGRSYLYCPRGPVLSGKTQGSKSKKSWGLILAKTREIGQKERAIFWRFDLPYPKLPQGFKNVSLNKAAVNVQPRHTLILDLIRGEQELLGAMKPKTRYNIRLAQRKGVQVRQSTAKKDLEMFLGLLQATAQRGNFRPHPDLYYQKMIEVLGPRGLVKIFLAEYQGKIIAANLVLFFGKRAVYLHGASDHKHCNVMAPHLLQWEQIREAKRRGYTEYDFWGIAPTRVTSYELRIANWTGITRFKKGFGGREVSYAGTYDLILERFWYQIYHFVQRLR